VVEPGWNDRRNLAKPVIISLDSIISVATDQVSCDLDGEAAILNLASGAYYGLDPIGATVWNLLTSPIAVREIVDAMIAQYDVNRARCERDLLALLAQLDERGLIQIGDGNGR
jgi:Coenzyme PQQ synthesis protein D (PqqD)